MRNLFNSMQSMFGKHNDNVLAAIAAPVSGELLEISQVPDAVFAGKLLGDGFAIAPSDGLVVSPADGVISSLPDSRHAVALTADNGLEMIVHFGLETVLLSGEGFTALVKEGERVTAGQPLIKVDLDFVRERAASLVTPVVFTNLPEGKTVKVTAGRRVIAGESGFAQYS